MNRLSPIIAEPDKICVKFLFLTKILTRTRYDRPQKQERVIKMSHRKKAAAQVTLLLAGAAMLCCGVWRGEAATVLSKAIKLCRECGGIGEEEYFGRVPSFGPFSGLDTGGSGLIDLPAPAELSQGRLV